MIEPVAFPDPGELPVVDWVSKSIIDVDAAYQRPEDAARAEKIARAFSWSKFGAIVLVPNRETPDRYVVIDGQHRVAAAKLHPLVDNLPAVIMPSVTGTAAEATSFIGLNAERKSVNTLELFHARRAAGDEDVQTVDQVLARAGVTVPRYPGAKYKPGETVAVGVIQALIGRRGAMRARQCLEVLAKAGCTPIAGNQIKAVEQLMFDPEFAGTVDADDLTSVVQEMGAAAETEAKRFAATHCIPLWKALASTWFQKCRKRRAPVSPAPASLAKPAPKYAPPVVSSDRRSLTGRAFGDPEPGRSALDQRKQA